MTNTEIQQLKGEILEKLNLPEEMSGYNLRRVREKLGISKGKFANDCGWHPRFQGWIEDYEQPLCHTGYFDKILTTLVLAYVKKFGQTS